MPVQLPVVDDTVLAQPPVGVVVCQVKYEQNLSVSDGDTALRMHEDLGGREGQYPTIEPQQVLAAQIELGAMGITSFGAGGFPRRGWRMRSADSQWIVSVMPEFVSLETTAYTTWTADFRERLIALFDTISRNVKPSVLERIGLRYVNRLAPADRTSPSDWRGAVTDTLLGPLADESWARGINTIQQQLDLDLGDDRRCIFRLGTLADPAGQVEGYLLDYDIYQQVPVRFDKESLVETLDGFNRAALALFQKSITPDYLYRLRTG